MNNDIPRYLDPINVLGADFQGRVPVRDMDRWLQMAEQQGTASDTVELSFRVQRLNGFIVIAGSLRTDVELVCQRCLSVYQHSISADIHWSPVNSNAEANALPQDLDPVQLGKNGLDVYWHLEDQLLLELPSFPKHQDISQCEQNAVIGNLAV